MSNTDSHRLWTATALGIEVITIAGEERRRGMSCPNEREALA
jgi:hypothetical protein